MKKKPAKPAPKKSPAARMGMTETEHRAHMKGGKAMKGGRSKGGY
jgi:hypothetical protein